MSRIWVVIFLGAFFQNLPTFAAHEPYENCSRFLDAKTAISQAISAQPIMRRIALNLRRKTLIRELTKLCGNTCLPRDAAKVVETQILKAGAASAELRGLAYIVGIMSASALASASLHEFLPETATAFLTPFLYQFTSLGIYAIGSRIWEPINARVRKHSFSSSAATSDKSLNDLWFQTNRRLSLNEQMSRNVLNSALLVIEPKLFRARDLVEKNPELAADQIRDVAWRLRELFPELSPSHPVVLTAVRAALGTSSGDKEAIRALLPLLRQRVDSNVMESMSIWFDEDAEHDVSK